MASNQAFPSARSPITKTTQARLQPANTVMKLCKETPKIPAKPRHCITDGNISKVLWQHLLCQADTHYTILS